MDSLYILTRGSVFRPRSDPTGLMGIYTVYQVLYWYCIQVTRYDILYDTALNELVGDAASWSRRAGLVIGAGALCQATW